MSLRREFRADFETAGHAVDKASTVRRPDAVSFDYLKALMPGPVALEDVAEGYFARSWSVRVDGGDVLYARGDEDGDAWEAETVLFSFDVAANPAVEISSAFDESGEIHVAIERSDGNIWLRSPGGALTSVGAGRTPLLSFYGEFNSTVLFYIRDDVLRFRIGPAFDGEVSTDISMENSYLERVVTDRDGRLHLVYSERDATTGRYSLHWFSSGDPEPLCVISFGATRIDNGDESLLVYQQDGTLRLQDLGECAGTEIDCLLVAAPGKHGSKNPGPGRGKDTTLWAALDGSALNPATDEPPPAHRALGGGHGGFGAQVGRPGGSGGGGGAASPFHFFPGIQGGGSGQQGGQGGRGGGLWGGFVQFTRTFAAAAGGGGSPFGDGEDGLWGRHIQQGGAGGPPGTIKLAGGVLVYVPGGGAGHAGYFRGPMPDSSDHIRVGGGQGAGGFVLVEGLQLVPGAVIPITVGQVAIVRVRRILTAATPAVLSGGVVTDEGGWRYHRYENPGTHEINVVTPGHAEAIVSGGGQGGDSAGDGGTGATVRHAVDLTFVEDGPVEVEVGAPGAGGVDGGKGQNGGESRIGALVRAPGGGQQEGPTYPQPKGEPGGWDGVAYHAGGGGIEGPGEDGATVEKMGPGVDEFDVYGPGSFEVPLEGGLQATGSVGKAILKDLAVGRQFIQVTLDHRGGMPWIIHARCVSEGGLTGYFFRLRSWGIHQPGIYRNALSGSGHRILTLTNAALNGTITAQFFVADGIQEVWHPDASGAAADTTHDGQDDRTVGLGRAGTPSAAVGIAHNKIVCSDKNITVNGLPAGWQVAVEDAEGVTVASAVEDSGTAKVDIMRVSCSADLPLEGFARLVVLDDADVEQGAAEGLIYPSEEEWEWDGELALTGEDLRPGPLYATTFVPALPGPEHGNGGPGFFMPAGWAHPAGERIAGGGGAGSEAVVAGEGGDGGGGDGTREVAAPGGAGTLPGAGGGGSRHPDQPGGEGGPGAVVIRTEIPV